MSAEEDNVAWNESESPCHPGGQIGSNTQRTRCDDRCSTSCGRTFTLPDRFCARATRSVRGVAMRRLARQTPSKLSGVRFGAPVLPMRPPHCCHRTAADNGRLVAVKRADPISNLPATHTLRGTVTHHPDDTSIFLLCSPSWPCSTHWLLCGPTHLTVVARIPLSRTLYLLLSTPLAPLGGRGVQPTHPPNSIPPALSWSRRSRTNAPTAWRTGWS